MKRRALKAGGLLLSLAAVLGILLLLRPRCVILELTGLYCTGCGTQRMIGALLQGNLAMAVRMNPFMLAVLPLTGIYLLAEAVRYVLGKRPLCKKRGMQAVLCGVLITAGAFMVLRNIPGWEWLGPLDVSR